MSADPYVSPPLKKVHSPHHFGSMRKDSGRSAFDERQFYFESYSEDIKCVVCLDPWMDPIEFLPCRHIVCQVCSESLTECPICKSQLTARVQPNRILVNLAAAVKVRCQYCTFVGTRKATHTCPNAPGSPGRVLRHPEGSPKRDLEPLVIQYPQKPKNGNAPPPPAAAYNMPSPAAAAAAAQAEALRNGSPQPGPQYHHHQVPTPQRVPFQYPHHVHPRGRPGIPQAQPVHYAHPEPTFPTYEADVSDLDASLRYGIAPLQVQALSQPSTMVINGVAHRVIGVETIVEDDDDTFGQTYPNMTSHAYIHPSGQVVYDQPAYLSDNSPIYVKPPRRTYGNHVRRYIPQDSDDSVVSRASTITPRAHAFASAAQQVTYYSDGSVGYTHAATMIHSNPFGAVSPAYAMTPQKVSLTPIAQGRAFVTAGGFVTPTSFGSPQYGSPQYFYQ